jgi:hypothetical protein
MPKVSRRTTGSQTTYCPACREEFLTYNTVASTECPFCHRLVRPAGQKWLLRAVAVLLIVGLLAAGAVTFWLRQKPLPQEPPALPGPPAVPA